MGEIMAENILADLREKQKTIQELQQKEQRRVGRLEQVMQDAEEKFGVKSLDEAQKELTRLSELVAADEAKLVDHDLRLGEIIANAEVSD
jgi:hypothetical protein